MRLNNQVALITGAASGIGRAIAERFAAEGARIVVADRNLPGAEQTVAQIHEAGGTALAIGVEVADSAAVSMMVQKSHAAYGWIDILVNNAGISQGDDILQIDEADWDNTLAVVLKSVFLCTKHVLPGMITRRHGVILNISSVNGHLGLGEESYSAAKAGMLNLTQNLAVKYGQYGIRANCISPATIRTPIWQPQLNQDPYVFDRLVPWYPLGRIGEPNDIANAALFLVSNEASWITGTTLVVDGGLMAGSYRMAQELLAGTPSTGL